MPESAVAIGLAVIEMTRDRRFDEIRERFAPQLRSLVSAEALRAAWDGELERLGSVVSVGTPVVEPTPQGTLVRIPASCERGSLTLLVTVTAGGDLAGLALGPPEAAAPVQPWEPPAYADPGLFDEREVTVGSGPLSVPGILSLPRGPGPVPGVVLLSGSGPNDRDGTVGRNKPLKDLAWGLASRGVAVLRFDKVTHVHPAEVREMPELTVMDEYAQAEAAIGLLANDPAVDGERIVLAGHSLGGTVAPRIAAAVPSVAGLVILAGGAQPLHWTIVRQMRHLASLAPGAAPVPDSTIGELVAQARRVDSADLSASTPAAELPFGLPAPYWLDMRDHDPVTAAAALHRPMLILQGGRDYQVTVADDLALWRAGLAGDPNVTIRVLDADNHFFFPGQGVSTPAELETAQHVDPAVLDAIEAWLAAFGSS